VQATAKWLRNRELFWSDGAILFLFKITAKDSIIPQLLSYTKPVYLPLRESMSEEKSPLKKAATPVQKQKELGLFETIGSFPVWLIRIIQALTPDSLIDKTPPKKKNVRI
jgi:hypothetical protein